MQGILLSSAYPFLKSSLVPRVKAFLLVIKDQGIIQCQQLVTSQLDSHGQSRQVACLDNVMQHKSIDGGWQVTADHY